jgi:diadenosine tetraphosphate (Ap4A) HIT family hydrolase
MMRYFKKAVLYLAHIEVFGTFVGFVFEYASFLVPIARYAENPLALCFDHPVPVTDFHLLAIPKRRVRTIFELAAPEQTETLVSVMRCIEAALCGECGDFLIVSNFGARQEVKQVHWHITRLSSERRKMLGGYNEAVYSAQGLQFYYRSTDGEGCLEVCSAGADGGFQDRSETVRRIQVVMETERQRLLESKGLSLLLQVHKENDRPLMWPNRIIFSIDE